MRELGRERGALAVREVGRIRDHAIEAAADRSGPVSPQEFDSRRHSECFGIFLREYERLVRAVGRDHARLWPFLRERERDRAAAGAEVEHARGRGRVGQEIERGGHQRLGVGPRDQHVPVHAQRQRPELALPGEQRHRHALARALEHELAEHRALAQGAGTGGTEAALFAHDLFRMYGRYAERRGWKVEPLSVSDSEAEAAGARSLVTGC